MGKSERIVKAVHSICLPLLVCIGIAIGLISQGCGQVELSSIWKDRDIVVDGEGADWRGGLVYVEDKKVSIGLMNDDEYLYLCLIPVDTQVQRQIMGQGFTVWLDPKGGKGRTLGIKFPLGMGGGGPEPDMSGGEKGKTPEDSEQDLKTLKDMFASSLKDLEILGPGENDSRRLAMTDLHGLEIAVGVVENTVVYELKVPLFEDGDHPYAIYADGAERQGTVGIGFETAQADKEAMMGGARGGDGEGGMSGGGGPPGGGMPRGGGPPGGGMSGSGGPPGGGMPRGGGPPGGGSGGGEREASQTLQVWAKVHLASEGETPSL